MRYQGRLTQWNDERGFGFITPNSGGPRVFVHRKDFESGRRPRGDELVTYELVTDAQKRLNARHVQYVGVASGARGKPALGMLLALAVTVTFFAYLATTTWQGRLHWIVPAAYAVMSALTYIAYGRDKTAAARREWRTREATLHGLALLCGWPGALLAQRQLRHKSGKASFQATFAITVAINVAALAWLMQNGHLR